MEIPDFIEQEINIQNDIILEESPELEQENSSVDRDKKDQEVLVESYKFSRNDFIEKISSHEKRVNSPR